MKSIGKLLNGMKASGIECGHVTQTENNNRIELVQISRCFYQSFGCSEQEWAVDAEDSCVRGNFLVLEDVGRVSPQVFVCNDRNSCRLRDLIDVEKRGERHADGNGDGKIRKNGQGKRCNPDSNISSR